VTADVLTRRALNRATLARQLLLERSPLTPLAAVEHLVGMQAQEPRDPYLGLWSRLDGFTPSDLEQLLLDRQVVRIVVMRGTIHLVTADDCLALRPLVQEVLDKELAAGREWAPHLRGLDLAPVLEHARTLFAEPLTMTELRAALAERFPDLDAPSLAYACRNHLALVQVPPRGLWSRSGQVRVTTVERWLGRSVAPNPSIDDLVLRYLGAFGPASVADVSAWSRLTAMREVVDDLVPQLRVFRDEHGRELFDLPDAPRPDPATPAPVRFLPMYDNALLSHADRSRFFGDEPRGLGAERPVHGTVLFDGDVTATWRTETARDTGRVTLTIDHVATRLPKRNASTLAANGRKVLRFLAPDAADHDVRLQPTA
jgi:hypothetical protein